MANAELLLVVEAAPGRYLIAWVASAALWIGLGLAFVVRLGLAVELGDGWGGLRRHWQRWVAVPALVVATVRT